MLAYLLLHPHQEHQRIFLAGMLDPEIPESTALRRLSQALWQIRAAFPAIERTRHSIRVAANAHYTTDVGDFEAAVIRADEETGETQLELWEEARALYSGPLLTGHYEDWVLLIRERLREQYLQVLSNLVLAYSKSGDYENALALARQLVELEPLNETHHVDVLRLYALLKREHEAIQHYQQLTQLLQDELGVRPGPKIQKLMQHINRQAAKTLEDQAPHLVALQQSPWVGREHVWSQMKQMLAKLRAGAGDLLVIRGETGIGKTRLQTELAQHAQWSGIQVWTATARNEAYPQPYCLWRQAIQPHLTPLHIEQLRLEMEDVWLEALVPLFPVIQETLPHLPRVPDLEGEATLHRLHEALKHLLHILARHNPLLILFDDVQWADSASLDFLQTLVETFKQHAALIVLNFCDDRRIDKKRLDTYIKHFPDVPTVIHLSPLSPAASDRLIQVTLGLTRPAPRFQKRLYQATQGHPLFLLETLQALREQGTLYKNELHLWSTLWDATTDDYSELPLSSRLQEFFTTRLTQISTIASNVLQVAAISTSYFDLDFLQATTTFSAQALVHATDELLKQHLLVVSERSFALVHDSMRDAILDKIDAATLRQLHHRVALALMQQDDVSPALVAHHFDNDGIWPEAIHFHAEAARQALKTAGFSSARRHLDAALALADQLNSSDETYFGLLEQREIVLNMLGDRTAQAADMIAMLALAHDDDLKRTHILLRRARMNMFISHFDQAEADASEALKLAKITQNRHDELIARLSYSQACIFRAKYAEAMFEHELILQLAQEIEQPTPRGQANQVMGNAMLGLGRYAEAKSYLNKALEIFRAHENQRGEADALHLLAILASQQGNSPLAHQYYQQELAICKRIGFLYGESKTLFNTGNLYLYEGAYFQSQQHYAAAREIFRQLKIKRGEMMALFNLAGIHLSLFGAEAHLLPDILNGLELAAEIGDAVGEGQGYGLLGGYHFHRGDLEQAQAHCEHGIDILMKKKKLWMVVQDMPLLVRVLLAQGKASMALRYLNNAQQIVDHLDAEQNDGTIPALRARAHWQKKNRANAQKWLREAAKHQYPKVNSGHLIAHWCMTMFQEFGDTRQSERAATAAWEVLEQMLDGFSPEFRQKSLEQIPEHGKIVQAYRRLSVESVVLLAVADAPTGRPLTPDEYVSVTWTIHSPEDRHYTTKVALRRHRLKRLTDEAATMGAAPTVEDLAAALQVSRATIKRDLASMRRAGTPLRTRGSR